MSSPNILVLEAFEHVHPDQSAAYEAAAPRIDDAVRQSEPGMLVHALTEVSRSDNEVVYRWLEIFDGAASLAAHFDNPADHKHVAKLNDGMLVAPTELVIYADWDEAEREEWRQRITGAKLIFAPVLAGYYLTR